MGAGKTTIGQLLAARLGWRFVDIDEAAVAMAGRSIPELFADGEEEFRQWERQAIAAHAHDEDTVIATGGGAIAQDDTRGLLVSLGPVVCLTAPLAVLWERAGTDPNRPLGQDFDVFKARHDSRKPVYERFPLRFDTSGVPPEALAAAIAAQVVHASARVDVALGERAYPIDVAPGNLWRLPSALPGDPGTCLVVTDDGVPQTYVETAMHALHYAGWAPVLEVLPAGEATKSIASAERLYDACIRSGLKRHQPIIALGGGVVGDLTGFVAATYQRGVPFVQVPTTLLAQIDSSVGGKVAVNHPRGKNLIGAFYQPVHVVADVGTLLTLSDREYGAGLAELLKYGVILDPDLFATVEANVQALRDRDLPLLTRLVARCCELKAQVVAQDEREMPGGPRGWLNFGHTLGHAVETVAGYGTWLHGEAVAIGMAAAGRLAATRGDWSVADAARLDALIRALDLPASVPDLPADELVAAMARDKKNRTAGTTFILPSRIGAVGYARIEEPELRQWLASEAVGK
ncbi:MAG: aroB [Cyanobacteria bacterium RYN_339]|nr:aroB [Cyanobacteria bacterium RYN_339]